MTFVTKSNEKIAKQKAKGIDGGGGWVEWQINLIWSLKQSIDKLENWPTI